jgi:hypothetical protein
MGFFEALPEPPAPRLPVEHRPPPWMGPPDNVMPGSVALDVLLARGERVAVWIAGARVDPHGVELTVVILHRDPFVTEPPPGIHRMPGRPEGPRFGVGFADGRRVALGGPAPGMRRGEGEIALTTRGGSGSQRRSSSTVYLWPLPPEGPLTFAFAWPEDGLEEVTVEVDSAPLRAAAARAVELWPDDRPPAPRQPGDDSGWTSYGPG